MRIREAQESGFSRVMELYRQLQPDDPVVTDAQDRDAFTRILREPSLHLFVLEDDGCIQASC